MPSKTSLKHGSGTFTWQIVKPVSGKELPAKGQNVQKRTKRIIGPNILRKVIKVIRYAKTSINREGHGLPEIKQVLFGLKRPGERIGDVVERVIQDRKRDEFIEFLDKRAKEAQYVPIESDPEMARMMQGQG